MVDHAPRTSKRASHVSRCNVPSCVTLLIWSNFGTRHPNFRNINSHAKTICHSPCIPNCRLPQSPTFSERRSDLMVSAFVPGASGPGLSPGWGHCVVFLSKTLNSQCLSPPRSIPVPANCWGNLTNLRGSDLRWTSRPRGVEIAASCHRNRDKLRKHEPVLACRLHSKPVCTKLDDEVVQ